MFDIEYKGANAVKITTKKSTLVTDPNLELVGKQSLNVKDVVEVTTEDRFVVDGAGAQLIINSPGEYEVGDFAIRGIATRRHIDTESDDLMATMYRIEVGDARIGLIGNIDAHLTEEQLEQLGVIDILILPVGGGGYTLDATSAASLVRRIEPKVVVPVHYADNGLKYEVPQDDCDTFIKELGATTEETAKFKVKSVTGLPATLTVVKITRP